MAAHKEPASSRHKCTPGSSSVSAIPVYKSTNQITDSRHLRNLASSTEMMPDNVIIFPTRSNLPQNLRQVYCRLLNPLTYWRYDTMQWCTEWGWGVGVFNPQTRPPKFRSFDKAESNPEFRGQYIRKNPIRIWVSIIGKLSGTPDYGLPPPDPPSLCPLSSTEIVEPPIPGYATGTMNSELKTLCQNAVRGHPPRYACLSVRNSAATTRPHVVFYIGDFY
jgi:hypothetical protein